MSMKFTRKGFFKSIFGGVLTAVAAPSLLKAEEKPLNVKTNANIGLGISNPAFPLVVSGLIFQVGEVNIWWSHDMKFNHIYYWENVTEFDPKNRR